MSNPELHNPHLDGSPFYWKSGPVGVLLIHGFTATTVEIRPLADRLHQHGMTVAAPLLPGHGTRLHDLNRVRWQDWLASAEAEYLRLREDCSQVFVAGESMGGAVALNLASRHPQVAGIVTFAPAIRLTLSPFQVLQLRLAAPFVVQVGRDSLDCSETWQGYPGLPLKGALQLLALQRDTLPRLLDIRQPVLVFQGRLDTTVHSSAGKIILDAVSSEIKEHYWMEHSNHAIPLDCEVDLVFERMLKFMQRCVPGFAG